MEALRLFLHFLLLTFPFQGALAGLGILIIREEIKKRKGRSDENE